MSNNSLRWLNCYLWFPKLTKAGISLLQYDRLFQVGRQHHAGLLPPWGWGVLHGHHLGGPVLGGLSRGGQDRSGPGGLRGAPHTPRGGHEGDRGPWVAEYGLGGRLGWGSLRVRWGYSCRLFIFICTTWIMNRGGVMEVLLIWIHG